MAEIKRPTHFRVLIIGRANAGKTTILRALCGTDDEPEVYDRKGNKIGSVRTAFRSIRNKVTGRDSGATLSPSSMRGLHKIDYSLIFPSNRGYIFHDSRGFESGAADELELVRDFIQTRADSNDLDQQLHAIWYCFPTDGNRLITAAEQEFFEKIDTGRVPVIAVFTKFDALDSAAFKILEAGGLSFDEAKQGAPAHAEELFKTTHLPLIQNQPHPPKGVVCLRNMQSNDSHRGVSDLIEKTFTSLDEDALKLLLVSVQHNNIKLCIQAVVGSGIITNAAKALVKQREVSSFEPDGQFLWGILKWFPYIWRVDTLEDNTLWQLTLEYTGYEEGGYGNKNEIKAGQKEEYAKELYEKYGNEWKQWNGWKGEWEGLKELLKELKEQDWTKGWKGDEDGHRHNMYHAFDEIHNALTPLPSSLACPNHPPLEALLIGLAIITVAADSFWIQPGNVNALGIKQAFQHYVTSGASENVKALVLDAFPKPIDSYSTHDCNTKLLQIFINNHIGPFTVGQPGGSGSA